MIDREKMLDNLARNIFKVLETNHDLTDFAHGKDIHPLILATSMKWIYEQTVQYLAMDMKTNKSLREAMKQRLSHHLDDSYKQNMQSVRDAIDEMIKLTDVCFFNANLR